MQDTKGLYAILAKKAMEKSILMLVQNVMDFISSFGQH